MDKPVCGLCGKPAEVEDTEYNEFYCEKHARSYQVFDGPYRWIDLTE